MIIDYIVSEFFSVIVVFLILTATIVVLFHLNNNHLDKADEIPQDVIMESNNNKEVTENKRIHRVKDVYWFQLII